VSIQIVLESLITRIKASFCVSGNTYPRRLNFVRTIRPMCLF